MMSDRYPHAGPIRAAGAEAASTSVSTRRPPRMGPSGGRVRPVHTSVHPGAEGIPGSGPARVDEPAPRGAAVHPGTGPVHPGVGPEGGRVHLAAKGVHPAGGRIGPPARPRGGHGEGLRAGAGVEAATLVWSTRPLARPGAVLVAGGRYEGPASVVAAPVLALLAGGVR